MRAFLKGDEEVTQAHTEQPALLPCPFCGGRAEFDEHDADCYFTKLQALKQSKDTADMGPAIELIPAWNRRTPASQAREPLSGFSLAYIGAKHFGNPIPREWYSAARDLETTHGIITQEQQG